MNNMLVTQITLNTPEKFKFYDLTNQVAEFVKTNNIQQGMVTVRTMHTTTAVIINENEPCLLRDMQCWLENIAPSVCAYEHDDMSKRINCPLDEPKNAHAHLQAALLGSSVTVPVIDGALSLGKWQSVLFVEMDGPRPARNLQIIIQS